MDLLAGLAQGQGAGLLPRAEAAFWRRKPCLAECHRSRRMRRRGEQSGRLGGYNYNMEHMYKPSNCQEETVPSLIRLGTISLDNSFALYLWWVYI